MPNPLESILYTYVFELKKQKKKFYIFLIITLAISVLSNLYPYVAFPEQSISSTRMSFLSGGLGFISLLTLILGCLFFGGLIVSEYSTKTGFIVFPKINKYKLLLGKYLANLTLVAIIMFVYYYFLALVALYYYGPPIPIQFIYSFGIAMLYVLALSGFVALFSSFMKSVNMTIIASFLVLLMGFSIVDQIIVLTNPNIEPLYSLSYVGGLITSIVQENFPTSTSGRYMDFEIQDFTFRTWLTPSIGMGILVLLLYTVVCMILAAIIFSRKQL